MPYAHLPWIVILGLDPSIQGNRSVTCPWTLGSRPRVTKRAGGTAWCDDNTEWAEPARRRRLKGRAPASEIGKHTSELQSLMRISYAVFCLKKKRSTAVSNKSTTTNHDINTRP